MPKIPSKYDPFAQTSLYDELGLDPYADSEAVNARLQEFAVELESLPDKEKNAKIAIFQQTMKKLKNARNRVPLNILIPDKLWKPLLQQQFNEAEKGLQISDLKMPSMDVSSILTEGDLLEFVAADFKDPELPDTLKVDHEELERELKAEAVPRYISFES